MRRCTYRTTYRLTVKESEGEEYEVVTDHLRLRCNNGTGIAFITEVGTFLLEQIIRVARIPQPAEPGRVRTPDTNDLSPDKVREIQLGSDCWTVECIPVDGSPLWSIPFAYLTSAERQEVARRATDPYGVRDYWWLCNFDW